MSCGIYKLIFGGSLYYVGKSTNIEQRFKKHLINLKNNLASNKVQKAYETYGKPTIEIIELCEISALNTKEIHYISLLDSINTGLNISPGGEYFTSGTTNPNSKHSEEFIEEIFFYTIQNINTPIIELSIVLGINYNTLFDIVNCKAHLWLKEKYPEEYTALEKSKNTRVSKNGKNCKNASDRGILYPSIISPKGIIYTINNVSSFIKEHNLSNRLYNLLKGRVSTYKGWRLHKGDIS